MLLPLVAPGVEQSDDLAAERIDTGQIRPLAQIAPVTGQGKIVRMVRPAVLPGNDVLDVVGEFNVTLMQQTLFATLLRSPTDQHSAWRSPPLIVGWRI